MSVQLILNSAKMEIVSIRGGASYATATMVTEQLQLSKAVKVAIALF